MVKLLCIVYYKANRYNMAFALSRTYRPKTLTDLLGQETTVRILQNAARENRLGQAYLFYGPRGTGKTTTARLLAKLANCERRRTDASFRAKGEPCNTCLLCKTIDEQASFDVVEIDAASNRGIDEIKNLKEAIKIAPALGTTRVYIIDEAHMLTGPAFNALLKTLEEPPAHAMFILATTEYEKLPATITSRTQRFAFKRLPKTKIMEKLTSIAKAEKIKIDEAAIELVAAAGEGSFRDAESILDQLRSFEKEIDLAAAERLTGRIGFRKVEEFMDLILASDAKSALAAAAELQEEGHNLTSLVKELIHYLRKTIALSVNSNLEGIYKSELTAEELARMKERASKIQPQKHLPILKNLIRAYSEMRYSPFPMIPLEIAILENLKSEPKS